MSKERLQKIIARAGLASRRAAEKFIVEGRVLVNGEVMRELGAQADEQTDTIEVVGHGILEPQRKVYIALHKPIHVISSVHDPEKRRTVIDVLTDTRAVGRREHEGELPRVYPVGRLDFDAEGLILLTNDGDLANQLTHPKYHVPRTYMVKVRGTPEEKSMERLRRGVRLKRDDGTLTRRTKPAEVSAVKRNATNTWLDITLFEGRFHQVKRMCEAIGAPVIRLIRIRFGSIAVDDLDAGAWRFLTGAEVAELRQWTDARAPRAVKPRVPAMQALPPGKAGKASKKPAGARPAKGGPTVRAKGAGAKEMGRNVTEKAASVRAAKADFNVGSTGAGGKRASKKTVGARPSSTAPGQAKTNSGRGALSKVAKRGASKGPSRKSGGASSAARGSTARRSTKRSS